jgi:hypothetical protein
MDSMDDATLVLTADIHGNTWALDAVVTDIKA